MALRMLESMSGKIDGNRVPSALRIYSFQRRTWPICVDRYRVDEKTGEHSWGDWEEYVRPAKGCLNKGIFDLASKMGMRFRALLRQVREKK